MYMYPNVMRACLHAYVAWPTGLLTLTALSLLDKSLAEVLVCCWSATSGLQLHWGTRLLMRGRYDPA
jgi:hypothetical protein